ncbi:metal-dependent hydrolase [Methanothrix soehngenii]|uniref:metal-dependent hydrolase n=1 Tax=Methanothrix soehngenii TaxID=2223 RepID=UPI003AB97BBD
MSVVLCASAPLWLGQCIAVHHCGKDTEKFSIPVYPYRIGSPSPPRPWPRLTVLRARAKKPQNRFIPSHPTFIQCSSSPMWAWPWPPLASIAGWTYLFLALGSILPDIIDKPLGLLLFGTPNMGRTFAHTLLFLLILGAISLRLRDIRLASLTWGVFIHLILDSMWSLQSSSSGLCWEDFPQLHTWIH